MKYKDAFKKLKRQLTTIFILSIFDPKKEFIIKIDIFNKAIRATLNQKGDDKKLIFTVFYLRKITALEINYNIYDKKLLVIVKAL